MKRILLGLITLLAAHAAGASEARRAERAEARQARADAANDPTGAAGFDAFRVIGEKNIFNPNRTGRSRGEEVAPRMDQISFVGTMDYDRGLFAFFDGSESGYRKALRVGESVGPFKVTKIAPNSIEVERDGKAFPMGMGQQWRRPEGGDWNLVGADLARLDAQNARAADAARGASATAPVAIPADADPVLRRLMESRNKSLKQ